MASEYTAVLNIKLLAEEALDVTADPGTDGVLPALVENNTGGRRWSDGTGSGKVGRSYKRIRTIGSGATDSYDLLAAGSLTTPAGAAIDLDELKGFALKVTAGAIKLVGASANGLDCFTGAGEGIKLSATGGIRCVAFDLGPDGLDVATNSKFDIIETTSAGTATYELEFIGAE